MTSPVNNQHVKVVVGTCIVSSGQQGNAAATHVMFSSRSCAEDMQMRIICKYQVPALHPKNFKKRCYTWMVPRALGMYQMQQQLRAGQAMLLLTHTHTVVATSAVLAVCNPCVAACIVATIVKSNPWLHAAACSPCIAARLVMCVTALLHPAGPLRHHARSF
jgi:hypothetical protein